MTEPDVTWWVTTGPLPGGRKIAGPFTEAGAFRERARIEAAQHRDDLWVQQEDGDPS